MSPCTHIIRIPGRASSRIIHRKKVIPRSKQSELPTIPAGLIEVYINAATHTHLINYLITYIRVYLE